MSKINYFKFSPKTRGKSQIKPEASRRKRVIVIRIEISETGNKQ